MRPKIFIARHEATWYLIPVIKSRDGASSSTRNRNPTNIEEIKPSLKIGLCVYCATTASVIYTKWFLRLSCCYHSSSVKFWRCLFVLLLAHSRCREIVTRTITRFWCDLPINEYGSAVGSFCVARLALKRHFSPREFRWTEINVCLRTYHANWCFEMFSPADRILNRCQIPLRS